MLGSPVPCAPGVLSLWCCRERDWKQADLHPPGHSCPPTQLYVLSQPSCLAAIFHPDHSGAAWALCCALVSNGPFPSLAVPFRETPSYTKRRRLLGAGGLASPRVLQRSASDNNLKAESRASYSPVPSLRSLPPQLLAQMQEAAAADGSVGSSGSVRSAHSRSPSLQRVQEEKEADVPSLRRSSRGKAR